MGGNNTTPRIIEFNGLPGTGKTTISRLLTNRIEDKFGPISFRYFRNKYHQSPYSLLLNSRYYSLINSIHKFSNQFGVDKPLSYSLIPAKYVRMYNNYIKDQKRGTLIIDQGFIQGLISVAHTEKILGENNLIDIFCKSRIEGMPILFVNCSCTQEIANARLMSRENKGSRVQHMKEQERVKAIETQYDNLSLIRSLLIQYCPNVYTIDIDTECDVNQNINHIMEYLHSL